MDKETRSFRADTKVEGKTLTGYAAIYNSFSQDLPLPEGRGTFREIIRPNAFDRCLAQGQDIRCLVDHDSSKILGRCKSGTLQVASDTRGLKYQVRELPNTSYANDLKESLTRGDIDECSFAFQVAEDGDNWRQENGTMVREIHDVEALYDVSPVTFPAYQNTNCALRSLENWTKTQPKTEVVDISELELRQRQVETEMAESK